MRETELPVVQHALATLSDQELVEIRDSLLGLNVPTDVLKKFWGGGFRINKLPLPLLRDGLARAFCDEPPIRQLLENFWRSRVSPLLSAVHTAASRWPGPNTDLLSDDAFAWVAERFQPSLEEMAWIHLACGSPAAPAPLDTSRIAHAGKSRILLPGPADRLCLARQLLANPSEGIGDVALELLGLFVDARDEIPSIVVELLASGELSGAASILERDCPDFVMEAALLRFLEGDLEAAGQFVEHSSGSGHLHEEQRLAFRALLALHRRNDLEALHAVAESTIEWPAWHLLRGLAHASGGRFIEAARSFVAEGGGNRSNSILPVEMAVAALDAASVPIPEYLRTLLEKGWASDQERIAASVAIADTIPTMPGVTLDEPFSAEPESAARGEPTSEIPATSELHKQSPLVSTRDTAPLASALPDLPSLGDPELQSRISELRSAVGDLLRLLSETASGINDLPTLQKLVRCAEQSRARVLETDKQLRSSSGINDVLPSPLRETDAGSREPLLAYFRSVASAVVDLADRRAREVSEKKAIWLKRCSDVDYNAPVDLDRATTANELAEAVSELRPGLARHTFARALRTGDKCPDWARLAPRDRLTAYSALLDAERQIPGLVLRDLTAALQDTEALRSGRESAVAFVAAAVRSLRDAQRPLPTGVWDALSKLAPGSLDATIQSLDLQATLRDADPDEVDAAGLSAAAEGHSALPEVARIIALHEGRTSTDARRRVELFAGLLELSPDDVTIQREFILALASSRRAAAALLVSRQASGALDERASWHLLLQAALEAKLQGQANTGIAVLVFDRPEEWVATPEDMIALLLVCSAEERKSAFDGWQYQLVDPVRIARTKYPGILASLTKDTNGGPAASALPSRDVSRVRELLDEFRSDNSKQTIFASWQGGGERYQEWLREEFDGLLGRVQGGDRGWLNDREFTPERLLTRGERSGLPRIYDHAARAARTLAEKQLSRLRELTRLIQGNAALARLLSEGRARDGGTNRASERENLLHAWRNQPGVAAAVNELLERELKT